MGHLAADFLAAQDRGMPTPRAIRRRQRRAVATRKALNRLGPFYTKLGQVMATRPDFVTTIMITELEKLQDRCSISPFSSFETVLTEDLGAQWRQMFADVDPDSPLGSASLAQVYRVTTAAGQVAALKVQRQGVRETFTADMAITMRIAKLLNRIFPRIHAMLDVETALRVVFDAMESELDFTIEANNMNEARAMVAKYSCLSIPKVLHATPRVLIQSMAPGISIREADPTAFTGREREQIGRDLLSFMYNGYFVHRFFHADPHPGNIFVHPGQGAWLLDWGMVGRLDRHLSSAMLLVLSSIAQNDGIAMAKAWMELGHPMPWADVRGFADDMSLLVPKLCSRSMGDLSLGVTLTALLRAAAKRGIRSSPLVALVGKSFGNIEGSVTCLTPELSVVGVFQDTLTDVLRGMASDLISKEQLGRSAIDVYLGGTTFLSQTREILDSVSGGQFGIRVGIDERTVFKAQTIGSQAKPLVLGALAAGAIVWLRGLRRAG
ncbi:ABC1 kinase family protein [Nocardia terpenica]|nr:AarF/UbiB family protein [Nocardia terpenica]NQE91191.1 AarF/ABC1/UbiB kinase family protein [Nocardia terpenica]